MTATQIQEVSPEEKCAVVVGGSRGIGRAVCVALAPSLSTVAIIYRGNVEAAETTARMVA